MSPEQQRICIAQACGWHITDQSVPVIPEPHEGFTVGPIATMEQSTNRFRLKHREKLVLSFNWSNFGKLEMLWPTLKNTVNNLPDYLNDLNACHEMEKQIIQAGGTFTKYIGWLEDLTQHNDDPAFHHAWHATAAQRAESFLRTIGKWHD